MHFKKVARVQHCKSILEEVFIEENKCSSNRKNIIQILKLVKITPSLNKDGILDCFIKETENNQFYRGNAQQIDPLRNYQIPSMQINFDANMYAENK